MGTAAEGAGALDGAPQDKAFLPREQRDQDKHPPESRLCAAGHAPARGARNPGVQDWRCHLLLQSRKLCCLLPCHPWAPGDSVEEHLITGDSGPEEGGRVPWWERGQTSFVYCKTHGVCIWSPVLPRHRTKCTRNQEGSRLMIT